MPPDFRLTLASENDVESAGEPAAERSTLPANVPRLVRESSEEPEDPALIIREEGFRDRVKSCTFTLTPTDLTWDPRTALKLAVYELPVEELKVTVELALPPAARVRLEALKAIESPAGTDKEVNATAPAKPFTLVTVTAALADEPALRTTGSRSIEIE